MALIPAFHEVYGWRLIPESRQRLHPDEWSTYNPAEHNADAVVTYLGKAGPRERARVTELERRGKQRKTVLEEAEPDSGDDAGDEVRPFDPAEHNRHDVIAYLSTADPAERTRVLELERAGKKRTTVLALGEAPQTPDAAGAGTTTTAGDDPGTSTED